MPQNKYVILRAKDCQDHLNPEQQNQLISIIQTIQAGRQTRGKGAADFFFVLNMKDKYAQAAIEAYITGLSSDSNLLNSNPKLQEVLRVAQSVRQEGLLKTTPGLPNQGA